ncbi:MAG: hypothetical protein HYU73_13910 [Betaproteobacteria bacterium]|nr:hypothetical protein [Betaproteobacteria bacterium]
MRERKLKLLGAALIGAALLSPAVQAAEPFDALRSFNAVVFQGWWSVAI